MKGNKYITMALVLFLAGSLSCNKTFLNTEPTASISGETFWQTASDAQMGLIGVYSTLHGGFLGYLRVYYDCLSDDAYSRTDQSGIADIAVGNLNPTTNLPTPIWNNTYKGISACNIFFENIDRVPMDEPTKREYKGEVHFLRALFYFELVNFFGGVPVYTTPPQTLAASYVPRTSADSVLALIYTDLDSAVASLPDTAYSGHAVKGSALALQARVLLYNQQWAAAAAAAGQVILSGKFKLYPNYAGIFFKKNQINGNSEIMFSSEYLAPNNFQNGTTGGLDIELGWQATINPYQEMVNAYGMNNGKAITDPASGYDPANPYANRDPRLLMSIKVPGQVWHNPDGSVFATFANPPNGYQAIKYVDTTLFPISYGVLTQNDEDLVHIRYADVLLMYAEAQNEVSGPDATIYNALNLIRARVNMPPVDQTVYGDQASLRTYIRNERRIELAFEGLRYFDLIRWRTAETVMPMVKNPAGIVGTFANYNYLFPIPQAEMDANPLLVQNPGY